VYFDSWHSWPSNISALNTLLEHLFTIKLFDIFNRQNWNEGIEGRKIIVEKISPVYVYSLSFELSIVYYELLCVNFVRCIEFYCIIGFHNTSFEISIACKNKLMFYMQQT
jgi:hypothetical protein